MEIVTADLSRFGYRELRLAANLLSAYCTQPTNFLGEGVTLNFNTYSGYVFLSDEDYRVGMLNSNDKLREWFYCPQCGREGFDGEVDYSDSSPLEFEKYQGYCSKTCQEKE